MVLLGELKCCSNWLAGSIRANGRGWEFTLCGEKTSVKLSVAALRRQETKLAEKDVA